MIASGLETPIADFDQDDLNRYPIVHRLFSTLTSVPSDWSVRIGLYAPWGEGKTSVQFLLRNFARSQGYFVVEYTPWSSPTLAQSVTLLFLAIVDECKRCDIELPGNQKTRFVAIQEKLRPFLAGISKAHAIGEIVAPLISQLFEDLFQTSQEWFKSLRKSVKDGRVIILIDDLDRASPEIIPFFLLALREKLDLPGFSFLLSFDNNIVVETIEAQNPAWKPGDNFIEKIIDIPFILPPSNVSQRVNLIKRAIEGQASDAIDSVKELLPESPRQLKLLARHVFALKSEVERHYPEELSWVAIVYCLMIRMESESFLQALAEEIEDIFYGYIALFNDADKQEENITNAVKSICNRCNIKEKRKIQRLTELVGALQTSTEWFSGDRLKYQATFADLPHAVTWKEFDHFVEYWRDSKQLALVADWAKKHASKVGSSSDSVIQEIIEATVNRRESQLRTAADNALTDQDHSKATAEAQPYNELLYQLLIDGCGLAEFEIIHTENNFSRVLQSFETFFHFSSQSVDKKMRAQEEKFLNDFVEKRVLPAQVLNKVLYNYSSQRGMQSSLANLSNSLISHLEPDLFDIGLDDFQRDGAWQKEDSEYNRGVRSLLLRRAAEDKAARNKLTTILREAKNKDTVHSNCIYFAEYLIRGLEGRESTKLENLAKQLLTGNFVTELWTSVTCRRLQFRARASIARIGDALREKTGATLKEPDWLKEWRDKAGKSE